jgi:thioredoxin 1
MSSNVTRVTSEQFEEQVLRSEQPVLVDFYAAWCGPCRILAPILEKIADEFAGRVKVVKVDIDHERDLAARYRITGVPTLILFEGGSDVWTTVGLPRGQELLEQLEKVSGRVGSKC